MPTINPTIFFQFVLPLLAGVESEAADIQAIIAEVASNDDLKTKTKKEIADFQDFLTKISTALD